jgi:hypothetical protein
MCDICDGISERFNPESLREGMQLAHQLARMVERGSLRVVGAPARSLDDVAARDLWDVMVFQLVCNGCTGLFRFEADSYHGRYTWSGRYFEEEKTGA